MHTKEERLKLFEENMKLAYFLVNKYFNKLSLSKLNIEDLNQEALVGLYLATEKYEPEKGTFSTYASKFIFARCYKYLYRKISTIHIPDTLLKVEDKDTSKDEIASLMNIESLSKPSVSYEVLNMMGDEEPSYQNIMDRIDIQQAIDKMPKYYKQFIMDHFYNNLSINDIMVKYNLFQPTASRVVQKAVDVFKTIITGKATEEELITYQIVNALSPTEAELYFLPARNINASKVVAFKDKYHLDNTSYITLKRKLNQKIDELVRITKLLRANPTDEILIQKKKKLIEESIYDFVETSSENAV